MGKRFKVAVTFGRFNLLHNGHLDLFRQMAEAADQYVIGVSTGPNNLVYRKRADVIQKALLAERWKVINGIFPKRQPFDLFKEVEHVAPDRVVLYLGEDQYKLAKAVERTYGWETRTIPRLSSSSLVRQLIDDEDWNLLSTQVPPSIINDVINLHLQTT